MGEAADSETLPVAVRTLRITVVGHSHIAALIHGYKVWRESNTGVRVKFIQLHTPEYRPPLLAGALNPMIDLAIAEGEPHAVLSCVGGNEHNVLGLLNHPVPFDFVLPEQPDLPLDETVDVVPAKIVESWMRARLEQITFRILGAVRQSVDSPLFHLESPPPIPSNDFIHSVPDSVFQDRIGDLGVAPAWLRYKLWRLRSSLVQGFASGLGIEIVFVPKNMQDANGMLVESAWQNATHANAHYGQEVLNKAIVQIRSAAC